MTFHAAPSSKEELGPSIKVFEDGELCFTSNLMHETHHLNADIGILALDISSFTHRSTMEDPTDVLLYGLNIDLDF